MYFEDDGTLKQIAEDLISDETIGLGHLGDCRICYILSDKAKKKNGNKVYADTRKATELVGFFSECDFIITFYLPHIANISEKAMRILMYHELRHIGFESAEEGYYCYIVPHDFEDFKSIVDEYGTDWINL